MPRVLISRGEQRDRQICRSISAPTASTHRSSAPARPATGANNEPGLNRIDFFPSSAVPFTKLAVPDVQLVARVARDLLDREPGRIAALRGWSSDRPLLRPATTITGPVFQRIFNTPGSALRAEVQARDRAVAHASADHGDRELRPHRQARWHRLRRRAASRASPTALNNRLYAKKDSSREILSATMQSYLHRRERGAVRSAATRAASARRQRRRTFRPCPAGPRRRRPLRPTRHSAPNTTPRSTRCGRSRPTAGWPTGLGRHHRRLEPEPRFIADLPGSTIRDAPTHYLNASVNVVGSRQRVRRPYTRSTTI